MNNVAVLLNNQGVDLLTKTNKAACMDTTMAEIEAATAIATNDDCYHHYDNGNQEDNRMTATTINPEDLDRATSLFEQALALILRNTEVHMHEGGLQYYESDGHGMIQYEDEHIRAQLIGSLNLQDTGVRMNGIDDESFIHWKAVKIGSNDDDYNDDNIYQNKHEGREYRHLSTSIFHSMICIYNLDLCYQYKGIQMSSRSLLEAAVDHYI